MKDILGLVAFVVAVFFGALLINTFLFRSFSVTGPSMETTLFTGDRLVVNRLTHAGALITGKPYLPARGEVIVFENPLFHLSRTDEYIVKRVIGLPGERVVVAAGVITVYNSEFPDGFQPDKDFTGPKSPTSGEIDLTVPKDEIFVAGDNREDGFSLDSRNGLGTIPLKNIQGKVLVRVYPFTRIRSF